MRVVESPPTTACGGGGVTTLQQMTDNDLLQLRLALQLACGRAHGTLVKKKQQWFCFLFTIVKVETDLRGLPQPPSKVHTADLRPPPQSL